MKLGFESQILGLGPGHEGQCLGLFLDLECSDFFILVLVLKISSFLVQQVGEIELLNG